MKKRKTIMVANFKGGTGKTTFCYQFLAPYLYATKSKRKPLVIDFDIANSEQETFSKSAIVDRLNCRLIDFDESIFFGKQDLIFDTGATTLAHETLKYFKNKGFLDLIEYFFIPFTPGLSTGTLALETYEVIKKYKADAKICFVFNTPYQDLGRYESIQFVPYVEDCWKVLSPENTDGKIDNLMRSDMYLMSMKIDYDPCLFWSTLLNLTAYEYSYKAGESNKKTDLNLNKSIFITRKYELAQRCKKFRSNLVQDIFRKFDVIFS